MANRLEEATRTPPRIKANMATIISNQVFAPVRARLAWTRPGRDEPQPRTVSVEPGAVDGEQDRGVTTERTPAA